MKKIFLSFFVILCLFLIGCEQPAPELPTYEEYEQELSEYLDELIPNVVTEDIDLPDLYMFEDESMSELEWVSSNGRTITRKGSYKQNLFDEEITIFLEKLIHTALINHQNKKDNVFKSSVLNQNYSYKK